MYVNNIQVSHLAAQNVRVMQMDNFNLHEGSHFLRLDLYHSLLFGTLYVTKFMTSRESRFRGWSGVSGVT